MRLIINKPIPDRSRPGLPTTAQVLHSRERVEIILLLNIVKQEEKERRKASKEASGSVERKTLTYKGGYLKYLNNDWKGKRAGRYDGTKEWRHTVSTGNKLEKE